MKPGNQPKSLRRSSPEPGESRLDRPSTMQRNGLPVGRVYNRCCVLIVPGRTQGLNVLVVTANHVHVGREATGERERAIEVVHDTVGVLGMLCATTDRLTQELTEESRPL